MPRGIRNSKQPVSLDARQRALYKQIFTERRTIASADTRRRVAIQIAHERSQLSDNGFRIHRTTSAVAGSAATLPRHHCSRVYPSRAVPLVREKPDPLDWAPSLRLSRGGGGGVGCRSRSSDRTGTRFGSSSTRLRSPQQSPRPTLGDCWGDRASCVRPGSRFAKKRRGRFLSPDPRGFIAKRRGKRRDGGALHAAGAAVAGRVEHDTLAFRLRARRMNVGLQ